MKSEKPLLKIVYDSIATLHTNNFMHAHKNSVFQGGSNKNWFNCSYLRDQWTDNTTCSSNITNTNYKTMPMKSKRMLQSYKIKIPQAERRRLSKMPMTHRHACCTLPFPTLTNHLKFNPLTPKSDWHLISPYSLTPESTI